MIRDVVRPTGRESLPHPAPGDAWLGGGTWLFSEPQPDLRRLVDLQALGWPSLQEDAAGLRIAATCTLAELDAYAGGSPRAAAGLIRQCCRALWGSFKIWNTATVGGNLCLALPAAPMAALAVALEADCLVWQPGGGTRLVPAHELIAGPRRTTLAAGELLRALHVPAATLDGRTAFRQASLTREGRSATLVIGREEAGGTVYTITAAVPRPLRLAFGTPPDAPTLAGAIDAAATDGWYDDVHGAPDWRRHMTLRLAEEIRAGFLGVPAAA